MKWKTDWGLQARMGFTMLMLFVIYLVFAYVIATYLGFGGIFMILLMGAFSLGSFFFSDKLTLWSMGAHEVDESEYPELHAMVSRLAQQADLPKPKVAIVDSRVPNAFATGRSQKKSAVCVTKGIMRTLDRDELEGVLAHELAHVKNRDVMVMTIASFISTMAFMVVRWSPFMGGGGRNRNNGGGVLIAIGVSIVVWIVSFILLRALSRYREYAADRGGAIISGKPAALASALMKISGEMEKVPQNDLRDEADMNAFFIIPIESGIVSRLISTHPSTEQRVERLRDMEREMETV